MTGLAALQRPPGLLRAPAGLGGRPLPATRLAAVSTRRGRAGLRCRAHQGHHSHGEQNHAHSCCSHDHSHEHHAHSHGCGHDHGGPDPSNAAHRVLSAAFDATRLTAAAAWLESSMPASIGKVVLFLMAAGAAGWASSGWAASAAAAAAARTLSTAATTGVYLLAGLPAAVDLSYDLTAGKIDTHVLMNLAVLGTLATGHALEVGAGCWAGHGLCGGAYQCVAAGAAASATACSAALPFAGYYVRRRLCTTTMLADSFTCWLATSVQGALLLVLFQSSHVVEHLLTERAQVCMKAGQWVLHVLLVLPLLRCRCCRR